MIKTPNLTLSDTCTKVDSAHTYADNIVLVLGIEIQMSFRFWLRQSQILKRIS